MNRNALLLLLAFFAFPGLSFAQGDPRDLLGLFVTVGEKDSIAQIIEKDSTLEVTFVNTSTKASRIENVQANSVQRQKILASYRAWTAAPKETAAAAEAAKPPQGARDVSAQRKNNLGYVLGQTALSYYVYSLVWPIGFEADPTTSTALTLISLPVEFVAHYMFQKKFKLHDAHIEGINYLTTEYLALTYSVPFIFSTGWDAFRMGSIVSMITYPIGIYSGFKLGEKNLDNPGRINIQSVFAWSGYGLGVASPFIYMSGDYDNSGALRALSLGSAVAFSIGGHFLGNRYLANKYIARGNPAGITTYGLLGLMTGLTVDSWIGFDNLNPNVGVALPWMGYLGGFLTGLNVFKDRSDLLERGTYNSLGTYGGMTLASGVLLLAPPDSPEIGLTAVTLGMYGGYFLTSYLTRDLVETPASKTSSAPFEIQLSLAPGAKVKRYQGRPSYTEYSVTPLTVKF